MIGVVCVLYGNSCLPELVERLAEKSDFCVIVVDNSGDLCSWPPSIGKLVVPGSNLGYSRGVNRGVEQLPSNIDGLVLLNPDIQAGADVIVDLVNIARTWTGPVVLAPKSIDGSFGYQPEPTVANTLVGHLLRRLNRPTSGKGFLSGALLVLNSEAVGMLLQGGILLCEDLFFMDDVELCDRARKMHVAIHEETVVGSIRHVGGESVLKRPAVGVYFSRVSKIRYWRRSQPMWSRVLAAFYVVEATLGLIVSRTSRLDSYRNDGGSRADGFRGVILHLALGDQSVDERVLGNVPSNVSLVAALRRFGFNYLSRLLKPSHR